MTRLFVLRSQLSRLFIIFKFYLVCELGGAHDFNDVERGPADIVAQHLKLKTKKKRHRKRCGLIKEEGGSKLSL